VEADNTLDPKTVELMTSAGVTDYDECLACQ
jgi:ribonucleoside-diphosphate reductase alpha chain